MEVFGEPLSPAEVVERICCGRATRGACGGAAIHGEAGWRAAYGRDVASAGERIWRRLTRRRRRSFWRRFAAFARTFCGFRTAILHRDVEVDGPHGSKLRQRYLPLERVGICVPGGAAAYPSTVLMTAVPAQAAGVEQIAVVSPPTPNGAYNQDVLATCHELGIREVYRVGGAQACCGAGVWRRRAWGGRS